MAYNFGHSVYTRITSVAIGTTTIEREDISNAKFSVESKNIELADGDARKMLKRYSFSCNLSNKSVSPFAVALNSDNVDLEIEFEDDSGTYSHVFSNCRIQVDYAWEKGRAVVQISVSQVQWPDSTVGLDAAEITLSASGVTAFVLPCTEIKVYPEIVADFVDDINYKSYERISGYKLFLDATLFGGAGEKNINSGDTDGGNLLAWLKADGKTAKCWDFNNSGNARNVVLRNKQMAVSFAEEALQQGKLFKLELKDESLQT